MRRAGMRPVRPGARRPGARAIALYVLCAALLAACVPATGPDSAAGPEAGTFGPDLVDTRRTACEARGGRWAAAGGADRFVCFTTPADAGRSCESAGDCSSVCLARSRTCAPVTPFFGCHEVLNARGARQTLCVQ